MRKKIVMIVGLINLCLGLIGVAVPLLPSFPFLLLAAICFAKSSKRLNDWFISTKVYKNNLQSYVEGRGMSKQAKIRLMITISLFMAIGFILMDKAPIGRWVLFFVWISHMVYFIFGVKNLKQKKAK